MPEPSTYEMEMESVRKAIPLRTELGWQFPADDDELLAELLRLEPELRILAVGLPAFKYAKTVVLPGPAGSKAESEWPSGASVQYADLTELPFSEKEFDYVICRNIVQQTSDPKAVCSELSRVAKRGFIEVPSACNEYLYGDPANQWLCSLENDSLVFRPKPFIRHPFGHTARKWLHTDPPFRQAFQYGGRSLFFIQLRWESSFSVQVHLPAAASDVPPSGERERIRECAQWLDCALNCMGHDIPELDETISHCLDKASTRLPGNKIVYTLKEIFRGKSQNSREFYQQLVKGLQAQDLLELLGKAEDKAAVHSADADQQTYPILSRIYGSRASFPLISVIIRTFNREQLLARCLDSVDRQIYPSIEIIVVNDGGPDVGHLLEHRKHPCQYIRHAANRGKAAALNTGLRMARGAYINILDDDDVLYPDHLALLALVVQNSPYRAAYADSFMTVDGRSEDEWKTIGKQLVYSQRHDLQLLLRTNYLPVLCLLFDRTLLEECGYIDERLEVLEDWDFWIRLAVKAEFLHVKRVTSEYSQRAHGDNATQESAEKFAQAQNLIRQKYENHMNSKGPRTELNLYPKPARRGLLSFFYWMENPEDFKPVITEFIRLFQEAGWTELVIGHPYDESSLSSLVNGLDQAAFRTVRWIRLEPADLTPAWFNQFDWVLSGDAKQEANSADITGPLLRYLDMADAVSRHPLFGILYRTQTKQPLVSIVILSRNQLAYTRQCIDSLFRHTNVPFELIAVDNGSTDGTRTYLNQLADRNDNIKLVLNVDNKGYGGGNNQGLALCRGDYTIIMNNDVIVTEGWIRYMLKAMHSDPRCGIVGPMSNYVAPPQQIVDPVYSLEKLDAYAAIHQETYRNRVVPVDRVIGFCMLIKREVIERIGGFDLRFGLGNFEDDDYCVRANLAGYRCLIAQEAFIHHYGSVTFKHDKDMNYTKIYLENCSKFIDKWNLQLQEDGVYNGWQIAQIRKSFSVSEHYCPLIPDMSVTGYLEQSAQLFEQGRFAECEAILLQCLASNGNSPVVRYNLLVNYMQTKNTEKAAECFEHLDENMPEVGNLKVIWYFWTGRHDLAAALMDRLLKKFPKDAQLQATKKYISSM